MDHDSLENIVMLCIRWYFILVTTKNTESTVVNFDGIKVSGSKKPRRIIYEIDIVIKSEFLVVYSLFTIHSNSLLCLQ